MTERIYAFEKLHVWAEIRSLVKNIYSITSSFPESEKYCLASQMRRAAISIGSNLAEGSSRSSMKDQARFYQISYGSLTELLSQLIVSYDLNYITESIYQNTRTSIQNISYTLNSLRRTSIKRHATQ